LQREQYDRAEQLAAEALSIRTDVLDPEHYQLSDSKELLARIQLRTDRPDQAAALLMSIRTDRIDRNDAPIKIAWTESNLGQALLDAGRLDEAEIHLQAAWTHMASDEGPGPESPHARETASALIRLYEETGRPDRAEQVRTQAFSSDD
ncbi:MAG: tetratricopeptide repeat protein, partial [Planctomycetota bacterium]|nr:tetratricopeptide repeat protein [Planctomycetota bacterium]